MLSFKTSHMFFKFVYYLFLLLLFYNVFKENSSTEIKLETLKLFILVEAIWSVYLISWVFLHKDPENKETMLNFEKKIIQEIIKNQIDIDKKINKALNNFFLEKEI